MCFMGTEWGQPGWWHNDEHRRLIWELSQARGHTTLPSFQSRRCSFRLASLSSPLLPLPAASPQDDIGKRMIAAMRDANRLRERFPAIRKGWANILHEDRLNGVMAWERIYDGEERIVCVFNAGRRVFTKGDYGMWVGGGQFKEVFCSSVRLLPPDLRYFSGLCALRPAPLPLERNSLLFRAVIERRLSSQAPEYSGNDAIISNGSEVKQSYDGAPVKSSGRPSPAPQQHDAGFRWRPTSDLATGSHPLAADTIPGHWITRVPARVTTPQASSGSICQRRRRLYSSMSTRRIRRKRTSDQGRLSGDRPSHQPSRATGPATVMSDTRRNHCPDYRSGRSARHKGTTSFFDDIV